MCYFDPHFVFVACVGSPLNNRGQVCIVFIKMQNKNVSSIRFRKHDTNTTKGKEASVTKVKNKLMDVSQQKKI